MKTKLISNILQHIPQNQQEEYAEIVEEAKVLLESRLQKLSDSDTKMNLFNISQILQYPYELLKDQQEVVLKYIKEYISFSTPIEFLRIVEALPNHSVSTNFSFYLPILRELSFHLQNIKQKLSMDAKIDLISKFSHCKIRIN